MRQARQYGGARPRWFTLGYILDPEAPEDLEAAITETTGEACAPGNGTPFGAKMPCLVVIYVAIVSVPLVDTWAKPA